MPSSIHTGVAAVLFGAVIGCDVVRRKIPNQLNLVVLVFGAAASFETARFAGVLSSFGAAALLLIALLPLWRLKTLGGGDLKAAVASAAWVGLDRLPEFAAVAALAGGCVATTCWLLSSASAKREILLNLRLATMRAMPRVPIQQVGGRVSVPYGAAIAFAAAFVVFRG